MKFLSRRRERPITDALRDAKWRLKDNERQLIEATHYIARLEEQNLENLRTLQSLAAACLIIRADPTADIGDDVEALLRDVSDRVAVIEEHLP